MMAIMVEEAHQIKVQINDPFEYRINIINCQNDKV